ncbi:transposase domain protein, partial [Vibrio cholerae HC-50A1]
MRDGSCQLGQLRGGGRTGAVQAQFAPRQLGGFHV